MKRTIQYADTGSRPKRLCAEVLKLSETEETSAVSSNIAHNDTCKLFLHGVNMYILLAGIGKIRAELFHKQLAIHGGDLSTTYDAANTTHILVDEKMDAQRMCRIMKLDKPPHPDDVVIVTSVWLSACLKAKELVSTEKFQLDLNSFESVFKSNNIHNNNPMNKEQKTTPDISIPQNSRATTVPSTSSENNPEVRKVPKVGMMFNAFTKRGVKNSSGEDSDYEPSGGEEDKEDCVRDATSESAISEAKNLPVSVLSSSAGLYFLSESVHSSSKCSFNLPVGVPFSFAAV